MVKLWQHTNTLRHVHTNTFMNKPVNTQTYEHTTLEQMHCFMSELCKNPKSAQMLKILETTMKRSKILEN